MESHPLLAWENPVKNVVNKNIPSLLGLFIVSASSIHSECCATAGIDWIAIDMEASPASRMDMIHIAQSLNGTEVILFVRVAQNNSQHIESALDIGAHGVIIPKVSSQKDAISAVKASYYPPEGKRGMNPIRCSAYFRNVENYLEKANKSTLCIVQIETKEAINNLEEISSVKGINGLFIGCGDLASDFGTPGDFENQEMHNARRLVLEACKKYNLIPGIFAYSERLASNYIQEGFVIIGIGNEIKFLQNALDKSILEIKKLSSIKNTT